MCIQASYVHDVSLSHCWNKCTLLHIRSYAYYYSDYNKRNQLCSACSNILLTDFSTCIPCSSTPTQHNNVETKHNLLMSILYNEAVVTLNQVANPSVGKCSVWKSKLHYTAS